MESKQTNHLQDWIKEEGYLINPTISVLREMANSIKPDNGKMNILVQQSTLRSIDREYTQSSQLRTLVDKGVISFKRLTGEYQTNLVVTDTTMGAFLTLDDMTVAVAADTDELVDEVKPTVVEMWDESTPLKLRTPSDSIVEETFNDLLEPDIYESFVTSVQAMEHAGRKVVDGGGNPFLGNGPIHASILVAGAVNETPLDKLVRCVERCSLASQSSLSRVKQEMEAEGYIATTSVETDIGRPPMQLHIAGLNTADDVALLAERVFDDLLRPPMGSSKE